MLKEFPIPNPVMSSFFIKEVIKEEIERLPSAKSTEFLFALLDKSPSAYL
jgi:hypothetical protein